MNKWIIWNNHDRNDFFKSLGFQIVAGTRVGPQPPPNLLAAANAVRHTARTVAAFLPHDAVPGEVCPSSLKGERYPRVGGSSKSTRWQGSIFPIHIQWGSFFSLRSQTKLWNILSQTIVFFLAKNTFGQILLNNFHTLPPGGSWPPA